MSGEISSVDVRLFHIPLAEVLVDAKHGEHQNDSSEEPFGGLADNLLGGGHSNFREEITSNITWQASSPRIALLSQTYSLLRIALRSMILPFTMTWFILVEFLMSVIGLSFKRTKSAA